MAEHESQAIFKIVIPYEEYQRLKTIEVQFHNLQHEFISLQSEKKHKVISESESDTLDNPTSPKNNSAKSLDGGGNNTSFINEESTSVPTLLEIDNPPPNLLPPNVIIKKDDESDFYSDARLMSEIPKAHIKKAQTLLLILNQRSAELNWNKDGTLFIDQVSLPQTNIYELFRQLFSRKKNPSSKGLIELIDKIQQMGLSHLITVRHRISKTKDIPESALIKSPSFWYLG